jgi:hypothetical protein
MLRVLAVISSILYLILSNTTVYAATIESKFNSLSNSNQGINNPIARFTNNTAEPVYSGASSLQMDEHDAEIILMVLIAAFFFLGLLFGIIFGFFLETYNKKNKMGVKKYHSYYKNTEAGYNRKQRINWSSFDVEKNPDVIKYQKTE